MIYLFKVYLLVTAVIFGAAFILLLIGASVTLGFRAFLQIYNFLLTPYRTAEPFSVLRHLKSKKVVHEGAA